MTWAALASMLVVVVMMVVMGRSIAVWQHRAQKAEAQAKQLQNEVEEWVDRWNRLQGISPTSRPPLSIVLNELSLRITELDNKLRELEKANEPILELEGPDAERAIKDADAKMGDVLEDL